MKATKAARVMLMLVVGLGLTGQAFAQPVSAPAPQEKAAEIEVIRLADLARIIEIAALCNIRAKGWKTKALEITMGAAVDEAKKNPKALTGENYVGAASAYAFGALYFAISSGTREFAQFGETACGTVEHSRALHLVDEMVSSVGAQRH